jgi:hypothetical protein
MTDLLGFGSNAVNVVTALPGETRVFGAPDTYAKDCSSPSANDGTVIPAAWANGILKQVRTAIRSAGVTEDNTDDSMLWKAMQAAGLVISTAITKTVYGSGPDFADLNAAFAWLSQRRISQAGSVNLVLAAGKFTSATTQVLQHPDGLRININGATMGGTLTNGGFALTGPSSAQRSADNVTNIAYLRTRFTTELAFTGGAGLVVNSPLGQVDQVLVSGDGTSTNGIALLLVRNGSVTLNRFAAHGHGICGIQVTQGFIAISSGGYVSSSGNLSNGYYASIGGNISNSGTMQAYSNGYDGINASFSSSIEWGGTSSLFYASGNAQSGFAAGWNSTIAIYPSTLSRSSYNGAFGFLSQMGSSVQAIGTQSNNNTQYGYYALTNSMLDCSQAVSLSGNSIGLYANYGSTILAIGVGFGSNTGGSATAFYESFIQTNGSTGVTSPSPALNTVGNSNSLITS